MSVNEIMKVLPHRYPFLLVDRIVELEPGKNAVGIKNVTINEPFFQGHFPERPIMPGVLILEAMAQATGILAFYSHKRQKKNDAVYYLVGIDKARFKRPVVPGDQLIMQAKLTRQLRGIYKFQASAHVDDQLVSAAEFMTTEMETDS